MINLTKIKNIYKNLKNIHQDNIQNKIELKLIKDNINNNFYSSDEIEIFLNDLKFISPKMLKEINNYKYYHYLNPLPDMFIHLKSKSAVLKSDDKKLLKTLIKEVELFRKYFKYNKPINIIIVPTNKKKLLPSSKNKIIGPNEVNSGANIFWGNDKQVLLIWRLEEIEKVLLHELIHYFKIDKGINERDYQEAFTETLTIIYYTLYRLINNNKSFTKFKIDINKELDFSIGQLVKLIKYWYPKKIPEIIYKSPIPNDVINKISPDTSVLGYYWIKTALLYNLVKNDDINLLLNSNKKKIKNRIMKSLRDKDFQNLIKKKYNKNEDGTNTLRMTKF